ncbi:DUF3877 family protein [Novisyntrophococcus fermenticellae]|uniref:DUF3877 family protein n=1 Tax=Novisyntrophococcus fermenticellae TaxID=2068655 RepID=UPI001E406281|nr:DUF3877 family protein [Novisyntrophococcus fermenticellae]
MNYNQLEKSLTDIMKEEQAKLGYKKEKIRLYYPLSSLNHLLETDVTAEEMPEVLRDFPAYIYNKFGMVQVSHTGERFCFTISEDASEYVHNNMRPNEFIKKLVDLVAEHGCTIEQIIDLFHASSGNIHVDSICNGEFDYLIYFEDTDDKYYYCFKDEGCHIIYHRFLPEDYDDFGF